VKNNIEQYFTGDDLMNSALIIGGNKHFNAALKNTFELLDFTAKKENCNLRKISEHYDYVIINDAVHKLDLDISCRYCFINMDTAKSAMVKIHGSIITYGLGNKNTLTISSLDDGYEGFVYCLQRYIKLDSQVNLEPQEIPVTLRYKNEEELYAMIVCISIRMLEGVDFKKIKNKLNNV
jgi:hypothetical protein